jgi:GMP synthase-like glutamine amidotransferase
MKIHWLQHVPFEGLARIEEWAGRSGHPITCTRLYANEKMPPVDSFDMLIIMGGPMGANDEAQFRWMKPEKLFIESALKRHKKVLGICLGAQLIASVLGAKVYPNTHQEIGWYPIDLDTVQAKHSPLSVLPHRVTVFHWHGDTFDLPRGALHLARSTACENQAFSIDNNVAGLQFHLELGMPQIESLLRQASEKLAAGPFTMDSETILDLSASHLPPLGASLFRFLDGFSQLS